MTSSSLKDQIEACCIDRNIFLSELHHRYTHGEVVKLTKKFFSFSPDLSIEEFSALIFKLPAKSQEAIVHALLIPLEDAPLHINAEIPDVVIMIRWRLEIGK